MGVIILIIIGEMEHARPRDRYWGLEKMDLDRFHRIQFRYLHKRVRIYENGITKPLDEIKAHQDPKAEGTFIPFHRIYGYEQSSNGKECRIIFSFDEQEN